MKLLYLFITVFVTFAMVFLASMLLDIGWVKNEISRVLVVYFMMAMVLLIGMAVGREIVNSE